MSRTPPPQIGRPTPIQPVAAPVSTYVRPPEPAPSNLHQLAQGLASFDSGLKKWIDKRQAERDREDAIRGEAAFNRNNQTGWAEGVASGAVPANASPIFMEAYKKAQGNRMGIQMREQFNLEYAQWEGRNSDDPEAFQTFLSDFVTRHITTDDAGILAGLNPHVSALAESASNTYGTDRANTVYRGHLDTRAALIGDIIDHASQQGLALENGTDYEGMKADILEQRQQALTSGIRMADFDGQLVAAIAAKAIEHGDPYLLDLLEETLPGYEVKLSSLPDFRDVKATTEASLVAEYRRRTEAEAKQQQAADKAREGAITTGVYRALSTDPTAEIPDEVIREWERYDPEARKKLVDARKSLTDGLTLEDPQDLITIERMIQSGATQDDIFELAANGVIKDPSTFKALVDRVQQRQEAGATILNTQTAKRFLTIIKERTAPPLGDAFLAPDGLTDEGIEATREFEQMMIEWALAHPDGTAFEREQHINAAADLILKRIDRTDEMNPQYLSQADLERQAAEEEATQRSVIEGFTGLAEEMASPPPQPPGSPQGSSVLNSAAELGRYVGANVQKPDYGQQAVDLYGGDAPPSLSDMGQTSRELIEQQAPALGMTPEELTLEIWKTMREDLGLSTEYTAPPPAAPSPAQLPPIPPPGQSQANPDIFGFVEPTSNPDVNPAVIKKFANRRLPVSIRNNNMGAVSIVGDVENSWAARQPGFVGVTPRPANEGGYYAKYATPEYGVAAASRLLERYGQQGVDTPLAIVTKWSADTNAHTAYASTLVKFLKEAGFNAGANTSIDLADPRVRFAVLKAKSQHEAGAGAPVYADAVFLRGVTYQFS